MYKNTQLEVDHIVSKLEDAKSAYYSTGEVIMSDEEYDAYEDRLRFLSPSHPFLSKVGLKKKEEGKVSHTKPMLSLAKSYEIDDIYKFLKDYQSIFATYKMDGISLSLIYAPYGFNIENNSIEGFSLMMAKTRGDGYEGESIMDKIPYISNIKKNIKMSSSIPSFLHLGFEIRGELCLRSSSFNQINEILSSKGEETKSSPRNLVSGLISRKLTEDSDIKTFLDLLEFESFDILPINHSSSLSEYHKFMTLRLLGFTTPESLIIKEDNDRSNTTVCHELISSFIDRAKVHKKMLKERNEIDIDGVVFSVNDHAKQKELGYTSHHPRYKLAFKWESEKAHSTIERIEWQMSRFGVYTPVAVIKPVELSGAMISNVSLHNLSHVKDYNLKTGDVVEIIRSGEVIPKFISVISSVDGEPLIPSTCKSCHKPLVDDGVRLMCKTHVNECGEKLFRSILDFMQKSGVDDLSEARLTLMMRQGLVSKLADIYSLKKEDLLTMPSFKEKMADKIIANIEKSRNMTSLTFLEALGVDGMGASKWKKLLSSFHSLDRIISLSKEDIVKEDGFSYASADKITSFFKENGYYIQTLRSLLNIKEKSDAREKDNTPSLSLKESLKGKVFVITGALSKKRGDVEKDIEESGGKLSSSVSKNTHYLVCNEASSSSKSVKAKELGVAIITEEELYNLINS